MQTDTAANLSLEYERYWHPELVHLPSQWVLALKELWDQLDNLNTVVLLSSEHRITWVSLRYQRYPAGTTVFASPLAHVRRWTPDHAMALVLALDTFHRRIAETCEECGSREGFRHKTLLGLGGDDRVLCHECGKKWQDQIHGR